MKTAKMVSLFKNEGCYYIFNLLYTDGEVKQTNLSMTRSLYSDREKLENWHNEIKAALEIEKDNPDFEKANKKLEELYNNVLKRMK